MPPCLDVYIITRDRTRAVVDRFLDGYVDRVASEDRGDEELMILPLGASTSDLPPDGWLWEPAHSLSHIVERGLGHPFRAFAVYLRPREAALEQAILAFTADGHVVFGVSIDDPEGTPEKLLEAKSLMTELASRFSAQSAFVAVEVPPPLFGTIPDWHDRIVHRWEHDAV
jgi:hypothetical protein